jgi:hypothetical protein
MPASVARQSGFSLVSGGVRGVQEWQKMQIAIRRAVRTTFASNTAPMLA